MSQNLDYWSLFSSSKQSHKTQIPNNLNFKASKNKHIQKEALMALWYVCTYVCMYIDQIRNQMPVLLIKRSMFGV